MSETFDRLKAQKELLMSRKNQICTKHPGDPGVKLCTRCRAQDVLIWTAVVVLSWIVIGCLWLVAWILK